MRLFTPFALLIGSVLLSSCTTPDEIKIAEPNLPPVATVRPMLEPTPRPDVEARITGANAIYLARVERDAERDHYIVTEVWRHDPVLGAAPQPGSEWRPGFSHRSTHGTQSWDEVLITIAATDAPLGRQARSTGTFPVANGRVVAGGAPLDVLHARILAGHPAKALAPRAHEGPSLDDCVTSAEVVYLARVEEGALVVTQIWRDRTGAGGVAVGQRIDSLTRRNPTANRGEAAVVFLFPKGYVGPSGTHTTQMARFVFNGYVDGDLSVDEVRRRVTRAD